MSNLGWLATPHLLKAKVFHKRTMPRENAFTYHVYYLAAPTAQIESLENALMGVNRFNLFSFMHRDHGYRDGRDSRLWAHAALARFDIDASTHRMVLITMPRVLGHVFNPVSFWLVLSPQDDLIAVIAEVNNTFKETHSYVLAHRDGRPITAEDWLESEKSFHVSPFLKVEGTYRFRFALSENGCGIWIDHLTPAGEPLLYTSLIGKAEPYSLLALLKAFVHIPFVTLKVIFLIHLQAFKLMGKKIRYIVKPAPPATDFTQGS
jgi:DUF1365 family protein